MVAGMSLGGRREAGSAHTTYDSEEEGVGGPPAQALGERDSAAGSGLPPSPKAIE